MNEAKIKTKPPTLAASRYDEENARKWTLHSQSAENRWQKFTEWQRREARLIPWVVSCDPACAVNSGLKT